MTPKKSGTNKTDNFLPLTDSKKIIKNKYFYTSKKINLLLTLKKSCVLVFGAVRTIKTLV